jgi:hypothetical protein
VRSVGLWLSLGNDGREAIVPCHSPNLLSA